MRDLCLPDFAHVRGGAVHLCERSIHVPLHILHIRAVSERRMTNFGVKWEPEKFRMGCTHHREIGHATTPTRNVHKREYLRAKDAAERVKKVVAYLRAAQVQYHLVAPQLTGTAWHVQTPVRVRGVQHLQM